MRCRALLLLVLVPLLGLALCTSACRVDEGDDPASIELHAAPAGWPSLAGRPPLGFAVGFRSELQARGDLGMRDYLTKVECIAGCTVEALASAAHPRYPSFRLTPLARKVTVRAHVAGAGPDNSDLVIERELVAEDSGLGGDHEGAGPGMPFLADMTIAWRLRPRSESAAWEPELSKVAFTGPFEIVAEERSTEGINVWFRARAPGRGTLVHRHGALEAAYPLQAVALADVRALHVAEAVGDAFAGHVSLRALLAPKLVVGLEKQKAAWVVFETASGELGIGGAGECLPAPGAGFALARQTSYGNWTTDPWTQGFYATELPTAEQLRNQPTLMLEGGRMPGTSVLLLQVGDVQGSVEVETK